MGAQKDVEIIEVNYKNFDKPVFVRLLLGPPGHCKVKAYFSTSKDILRCSKKVLDKVPFLYKSMNICYSGPLAVYRTIFEYDPKLDSSEGSSSSFHIANLAYFLKNEENEKIIRIDFYENRYITVRFKRIEEQAYSVHIEVKNLPALPVTDLSSMFNRYNRGVLTSNELPSMNDANRSYVHEVLYFKDGKLVNFNGSIPNDLDKLRKVVFEEFAKIPPEHLFHKDDAICYTYIFLMKYILPFLLLKAT